MSIVAKTSDHTALERLALFSDAVMAIAITLLVLEIKVPALHGRTTDAALQEALIELLPKFAGFAISFVVIGAFWQGHHRMFRYIGTFGSRLLMLNLYFLLFICFLPYPTGLFSEYPYLQTPFLLYGGTLGVAGLLQWNLWRHAEAAGLLAPHTDAATIRWIGRRTLVVPVVALVAVGLSFVNLSVAGMVFSSIPLWIAVVNRRARKAGVAG
jgi:uncharacterized membrane protein